MDPNAQQPSPWQMIQQQNGSVMAPPPSVQPTQPTATPQAAPVTPQATPQTVPQTSAPDASTGGLDPDVQTFTKAIAMQEGGGKLLSYDAPGGDGEIGRYQFLPKTWQLYAQQVLGDQNAPMTSANQNKVAYTMFKTWHDQGMTWAQMASQWNSGDPQGYLEPKSAHPDNDVAQYVSNVQKYAQQLDAQNQQLPGLGALSPNPTDTTQAPIPTGATPSTTSGATQSGSADPSGGFLQGLGEDLNGTNPDSLGDQIGNTLTGAGNFLFPIAGDLYNDVTGKNKKTALQQVGDTGTSVLSGLAALSNLIPGVGEAADAAEVARAGEAGAEGAGTVAKSGILQKLLSSETLKGAGTGYAYGTAQNLSNGQSLGQAVAPNASNLLGTASGGVLGAVVPRLGGLAEKISGIDPQIANELRSMGSEANPEDANLYDAYVNATKEHAANVRAKAPLTMAADNVDNAADIIGAHTDQAGAEVGAVKKAATNVPLDNNGVANVANDFQQKVASDYGVNLTTGIDGEVTATPIPGSMRQIAPKDLTRIETIYQQLQGLAGGSVKSGGEVIDNLNDLVDHTNQDTYGNTNDPLEGLFKYVAGGLKDTMHDSSPELKAADKKFSDLKNLQNEVRTMAGGKLQRGELLMKRLFSGDKSGDVNDFFQKIKDQTGLDLVKHAVLAKHAIESYGSKADQSLLQQAIEGGVKAHTGGVIPALINAGTGVARHTFANPETIGRNLVRGKTSNGILSKILINQGAHAGAGVGGAI